MDLLDMPIESGDFDKPLSLREFLKTLLATVWAEEESFSGKRPFGNSRWQHCVQIALVKNGFVDGKLDYNGGLEEINQAQAEAVMYHIIMDSIWMAPAP